MIVLRNFLLCLCFFLSTWPRVLADPPSLHDLLPTEYSECRSSCALSDVPGCHPGQACDCKQSNLDILDKCYACLAALKPSVAPDLQKLLEDFRNACNAGHLPGHLPVDNDTSISSVTHTSNGFVSQVVSHSGSLILVVLLFPLVYFTFISWTLYFFESSLCRWDLYFIIILTPLSFQPFRRMSRYHFPVFTLGA